jgi:hypothetical protein
MSSPALEECVRAARHSGRQRRVRAGRSASLERSARSADSPAMLGLAACRITRYVRFAHCALTDAASQRWKRAARAAASPPLLGAPEARCGLPERAFAAAPVVFAARDHSIAARQAVPDGGDFCGGEKRRPEVGARSAHPLLTRRICLNGESEANAVSYATRPQAEHRSGVGAERRPPQHEPTPGAACRAARTGRGTTSRDHPRREMQRAPRPHHSSSSS